MRRKPWILAGLGLLLAWLAWGLLLPAFPGRSAVVSVPQGAGLGQAARNLKAKGMLRSPFLFSWWARLSGHSGDIKAGDYEVPSGLNALQTLRLLVSGRTLMHPFLVREGLSAEQVAELLERQGLGSAQAFLAAVRDPALAGRLGLPGPDLEGCLFPDTYFLPKGMRERAVAELMVARFRQQVPDSLLKEGAAIKLKPLQVLTMASLIEKEARLDAERPKVSAVFRNRMRQKKRLESCATVRYALNKWKGPLFNRDLLANSPYNTYRNFGLPPGPICSPGLASIRAALQPAATDAMYFVVAGDGTHVFSRTLEEHNQAKARWKRLKRGMVDEAPAAE